MNGKILLRLTIIYLLITLIGITLVWPVYFLSLIDMPTLSNMNLMQKLGFVAGDIFLMPVLVISIVGLIKRKKYGMIFSYVGLGGFLYSGFLSLVASQFKDFFFSTWGVNYSITPIIFGFILWKIRDMME